MSKKLKSSDSHLPLHCTSRRRPISCPRQRKFRWIMKRIQGAVNPSKLQVSNLRQEGRRRRQTGWRRQCPSDQNDPVDIWRQTLNLPEPDALLDQDGGGRPAQRRQGRGFVQRHEAAPESVVRIDVALLPCSALLSLRTIHRTAEDRTLLHGPPVMGRPAGNRFEPMRFRVPLPSFKIEGIG